MVEILGKKYITPKEASKRYGMSLDWFSKRRYMKLPPEFSRVDEGCRVYYPLSETDKWFRNQLRMKEGG